ncbi:uncharacterized protein BX664DRAFT_287979 [Halteromyces radiatus]|uniref:uncharacterized protein n=1 Tax=Halteromyces radiatus TaxID=101107 RepID=UPI0022208076|nr:uncharacterized protein BX664DRAFT_287979 [Halteromyces radiatus]KAI8098476.1 hypothetical protein BX664DRAFT_287979 [Halteromyces radiatus]
MNGSPIPSSVTSSPKPNDIITVEGKRILCTADIKGCISQLNQLARDANAHCIIHTGDFGFYERSSLERIDDRTLKHLIQYSTLIPPYMRGRFNNSPIDQVRRTIETAPQQAYLSEFPDFLSGEKQLDVPVYTVWGVCEDVAILEKLRSGEYSVHNLHILDEATTYLLDIGGVKLRLFGLGGAVIQHKLFDNGEGTDTIAGGSGMMWTTALQIGELVETAQKVYDSSETRILVTHASPGREGLLAQLSLYLKADFTISAGLHFRYGIAYNEFACQSHQDHYRERLLQSQQNFLQLWETIKDQVESYVDNHQALLLQNTLEVVNRLPPSLHDSGDEGSEHSQNNRDEIAFKNLWNFNLPDAALGWIVLDVNNGHVGAEMKSQGFNFAYRRTNSSSNSLNHTPYAGSSPALSTATFPPRPYASSDKYKPDYQQGISRNNSINSGNDNISSNNSEMNDSSSNNKDDQNSYRQSKRQSSMQRSPYAIFVGGLNNGQVTENDIREFFDPKSVTDVRIPIDQETKLHKSHCYVDLVDPISLEAALAKNGQILKDNKLIINRSAPPQYGDNRRGRNGRGRSFRPPPK